MSGTLSPSRMPRIPLPGIIRLFTSKLTSVPNGSAPTMPHVPIAGTWPLVTLTVGVALVGIVTFGSLAGSMLPFVLRRFGFDPASASAPFVATLVDVTGLSIYFLVALIVLLATLL